MALFGLSKDRVEIHQQETVNGEQIDSLIISTSSANIEVLSVKGRDIGILLDGEMSENLAENYEFKIVQKSNRLDISFKANNDGFQFGSSYSNINLQVTLPEKMYQDIQVGSSSGEIEINRLTSKSLTSTSSSGSQVISGLKVKNRLFVKASSGDIVANGNDAGLAMMRASSGGVNLRGLDCDDVKLETSSGDVVYHNDTICGKLDCKASSGDVDIHIDQLPNSLNLDCKANSGDVKVRVDGIQFKEKTDHRVVASLGTGENSVYARTSSGDIVIY